MVQLWQEFALQFCNRGLSSETVQNRHPVIFSSTATLDNRGEEQAFVCIVFSVTQSLGGGSICHLRTSPGPMISWDEGRIRTKPNKNKKGLPVNTGWKNIYSVKHSDYFGSQRRSAAQ